MKIDYEKLHSIIIKSRLAKGFTQTNMADMLGISQKNYGYLESGRCRLSLTKFLIIADIMEINPLEIINEISSEYKWPGLYLNSNTEPENDMEEQIKILTKHNHFLQETIKSMLENNNNNKES